MSSSYPATSVAQVQHNGFGNPHTEADVLTAAAAEGRQHAWGAQMPLKQCPFRRVPSCQASPGPTDGTQEDFSTFLCAARPENSMRPRSALMSCSSASGAARSRVSVALSSESSASAW